MGSLSRQISSASRVSLTIHTIVNTIDQPFASALVCAWLKRSLSIPCSFTHCHPFETCVTASHGTRIEASRHIRIPPMDAAAHAVDMYLLSPSVYPTSLLRTMPPALPVPDIQPAPPCETAHSNRRGIPHAHISAKGAPLRFRVSIVSNTRRWKEFSLVKAISVTAKFWPMQILGPPLKGTYCHGLGVHFSHRSGLKMAASAKESETGG